MNKVKKVLKSLGKKLTNNRIEGIGLIFVLFSFFLQIAEEDFNNQKHEAENYNIHKKLDVIWRVYTKDFSSRNPEYGVSSAINFKHYNEDWKIYSENREEIKVWNDLVDYSGKYKMILFIIGSILIVIPKFRDK
ncbi:hypothetical protein [Sphingobacterium multivorum]|uniref:hypothetical protein n=1 Tax=Sphingobacterium multivorum TaxID=28454 RepID=UPI0028B21B70|nr:hypothetical protein [Sphingobacterium multivorum]